MSMDTNSKAPAVTVNTTKPVVTQPVVNTKAEAPKVTQPVETAKAPEVKEAKYKPEDYGGALIVKLRLIKAGTMQYDPIYKLKLSSIEPTEMPLTPFFAGRIGQTIELCA
jgi:hypothetical protein